MSKPIVLYFLRHAHTRANDSDEEKIRGQMECPATASGLAEVRKTAERLKKKNIVFDAIFTSPLGRSRKSAKEVSDVYGGVHTLVVKGLASWNQGDLQGKPVTSYGAREEWYVEHPTVRVPNGDSYETFLREWGNSLKSIIRYAEANPDSTILVVTHSKNLKSLRRLLTNQSGKSDNDVVVPDNAGVWRVSVGDKVVITEL